MRAILLCVLAIVLLAGQLATGAQALAMVPDGPAAMASGEMSGDCDECADSDSDGILCSANCCTPCGTTAALLPVQSIERLTAFRPRPEHVGRIWAGLTVSPRLTPPRLVLR